MKPAMNNIQVRLWLFCSTMFVTILAFVPLSLGQGQSHPVTVRAVRHAVAAPLDQTIPIPPQSRRYYPLPDDDDEDRPSTGPARVQRFVQDSVVQSAASTTLSALTSISTSAGLNILGLGTGFPGYSTQAVVPDTNGAVGATQFVQFVNESFAVFNKSTGALQYGPANGNTLWQSLGGPCAASPQLDEVVQYDQLANRWVMLMPVFTAPSYLCVAVSMTSSATSGGWNLYAFETIPNKICGCRMQPDYPKLSLWPDAYYVTYNQGWNLNFVGPAVCALNRSAMLNGSAASMQCFINNPTSYGSLLAADLDGSTAPPSGSPEYLMSFDNNGQSVDLYQLHVDWTTPSNSALTGPTNIPVAAFTEACGETVTELGYTTGACIPQSGTNQTLDSYADRLMYRLAYRNLGGHQSLVANHTVATGTGMQTGIRWYELRNTGSGFGIFQQGTYAPDANYRWMGSIAMDKAGDIAMGYSVSSSTLSPSIRYTGRLSTDPLGQMETEVDVLTAGSVPHTSLTNHWQWGDYSSIAIDPVDDCTFWFTTEYEATGGNNRWSTRIASFSFPACSGNTNSPGWSIVNTASNFGNPLNSLTIPSTGSGNLLAVAFNFNGTTSISNVSDNAGNTYISGGARAAKGNQSTEIWYVPNTTAGATVITPHYVGTPTHMEITSWEVSGLSTAAPDAKNIATGLVTLTDMPGPAVTTTMAGDFVVSVMFAGTASLSGVSSGNEFTNDFKTNGNGWAHLTSNSAAAGTHQASWHTASPAGGYTASTVAFHP
jgi:hypothetical protein